MPECRQTVMKDKKDILLQASHGCLEEGTKACKTTDFYSDIDLFYMAESQCEIVVCFLAVEYAVTIIWVCTKSL